MVPVELSIARVSVRVSEGGHSVPEEKIRQRFDRLWPLVDQAIQLADLAVVYDNTTPTDTRIVARFASGEAIIRPDWPAWTPPPLIGAGSK